MTKVIVVAIKDDKKREGLESSQSSVSFDCMTAILNDVEVAKSLGSNIHCATMDLYKFSLQNHRPLWSVDKQR